MADTSKNVFYGGPREGGKKYAEKLFKERNNRIHRVEITSNDVISDTAKSLVDFIMEAKKTALKEEIRANTVIIDKTFAKVNNIHFVVGKDILHIPPMICGLEVQITDELPDGYDFALVEAPETERERIVRQAKGEAAREIFEEIENNLNQWIELYHKIMVSTFDSIEQSKARASESVLCAFRDYIAELKKKYTEGRQ